MLGQEIAVHRSIWFDKGLMAACAPALSRMAGTEAPSRTGAVFSNE